VFDCDVQDALSFLMSLISTKPDLLSLQITVASKFDGWKGWHLYDWPQATLSLAMTLA